MTPKCDIICPCERHGHKRQYCVTLSTHCSPYWKHTLSWATFLFELKNNEKLNFLSWHYRCLMRGLQKLMMLKVIMADCKANYAINSDRPISLAGTAAWQTTSRNASEISTRKCKTCFGRVSSGRLVMKACAPQGDLFVSVFDMSRDLDCAQQHSKMSVSE